MYHSFTFAFLQCWNLRLFGKVDTARSCTRRVLCRSFGHRKDGQSVSKEACNYRQRFLAIHGDSVQQSTHGMVPGPEHDFLAEGAR